MEQFTKYEVARIIGARALQLAMDAPLLIKISEDELKKINYDVLKLAEMEFESGILPITVNRPLPKKIIGKLKASEEAEKKVEKEKIEKKEEKIEKKDMEEVESSEIMELATPEDEVEEEPSGEEEVIDED
jgi:DNA-directed RNA polymerase subunit K